MGSDVERDLDREVKEDLAREYVDRLRHAVAYAHGRLDAILDDDQRRTPEELFESLVEIRDSLRNPEEEGDLPELMAPRITRLEAGIERLGRWITSYVPGEPSRSEGAIDTAIRVLGSYQTRMIEARELLQAPGGDDWVAYPRFREAWREGADRWLELTARSITSTTPERPFYSPDGAKRIEEQFAKFFRDEAPEWGERGDAEGWNPITTALHLLRELHDPKPSSIFGIVTDGVAEDIARRVWAHAIDVSTRPPKEFIDRFVTLVREVLVPHVVLQVNHSFLVGLRKLEREAASLVRKAVRRD